MDGDDKDLWEQAMRGVKKIPDPKPRKQPQEKPIFFSYIERPAHNVVREKFEGRRSVGAWLDLGNLSAVDKNTASALRRGKYPIDRTIDLHGMTREQAYQSLRKALLSTLAAHGRCLLVITGKGRILENREGVIRASLAEWLNMEELRPYILAYCHAAPKDGGTGAVYILLRRVR